MRSSSLLLLLLAGPLALGAERRAWVGNIQGDVKVDGRAARNGEIIKPGTSLRTGDGTASIFLVGEALVRVGKNTDTTLTRLASAAPLDAEVSVAQGRLRALLRDGSPKRVLNIRSRSAVMGVRGSHAVNETPAGGGPPSFLLVEGKGSVTTPDGAVVPLAPLQRYEVGSSGPVNVSAQEAEAAVESVAPTSSEELDISGADESAGREPSEADAKTEGAPTEESVFEELGDLFPAELDPLADSPKARMTVNFTF